MGRYYLIKCLDCDKSGGIWEERSTSRAKQALLLSGAIAEFAASLGDALTKSDRWHNIDLKIGGDLIDLHFFHVHRGHELTVIDSYGTLLGQCPMYTSDGESCRLSEGHEGRCRRT